jgi:ATP-dependent DNA helicase DinG
VDAASPDEGAPPPVTGLLAAAVDGIGGTARPGQDAMAEAVWRAIGTGEHLAVQAGTGTGKSLAYLVPAAAHAIGRGSSVVVATATIALQRQLIDRDLPRLTPALAPLLGREPTFAILKGRRNYLCLHRLRTGPPDEPGETLFDPADVSAMGRQMRRLTEWAADTATGDRDELVPGVELVVFCRARPRGGRAGGHRRHQPRAARDRRAGGLPGPARTRRGDH